MQILIIEDEKPLASALKQILDKNGFNVTLAFDGEEGLRFALTNAFKAIILDVMLPKKDGFMVIKSLREEKNLTPVIMLTAKSDVESKILGLDFGADDYLAKPFDTKELLARVRALLRRGEKSFDDKELSFANITLSLSTVSIKNDTNQSVSLSKKEFNLFRLFMENTKQVLSKEQINQRVWGFDSEAEYNNTEVYISFLRKKLNFINSCADIKTIRGIGYILEEK
ncbi:MAG: response regulator transcription factor [Treponemataceae bacterium]